MSDNDFIHTHSAETNVVVVPTDQVVTTVTHEQAVTVVEQEVKVAVETKEVYVVAVGAQGPSGGAPAGENDITLEAGENLSAGTPVKVVSNLVYAASHAEANPVVGLIRSATLSGFLATICTGGKVALTGLTPGSPYFLGVGAITATAPSSGYVVRLGTAVTASVLLVEIEAPIQLS